MQLLGIITGMLIAIIVTVCYIVIIAFTLWMAIDAGKQDRFWWLTLIIGLPVIGPAVYYFTEKKHEYAKLPAHHIHTSETEEQHEVSHRKKKQKKEKKEEEVKKEEPKPEPTTEEPKVEEQPIETVAQTEETKSSE